MELPRTTSQVTLDGEGKQYTASFELGWGVMTVTSGSVARVIAIGEAATSPQSVARTIPGSMVCEHFLDAEPNPLRRGHY